MTFEPGQTTASPTATEATDRAHAGPRVEQDAGGSSLAPASGMPTTRILHLSDLHFGRPVLPEVCRAVLDLGARTRPDVVVVSGDLTQRARREEFEAAREFLDALPRVPRIVVPGNHDVPLYRLHERLLSPRALYREWIDPDPSPTLHRPGATFVGLDSTDPYRSIKNGRLGRDALARCEAIFAGADPASWRIVVLHHHLIPAPSFDRVRPMPRSQRALEAFTRMKVDLVLAGHLHRAYVGNSLDVYAGSQRDSGSIIVQCGTSTSRRGRGAERESNSLNWIEVGPDGVEVTHHLYLGSEQGFSAVSRHRFARPRAGALRTGLEAPA